MSAPLYDLAHAEQTPEVQGWLADAEKAMRAEAEVLRSRARMDAMFTAADLFDEVA